MFFTPTILLPCNLSKKESRNVSWGEDLKKVYSGKKGTLHLSQGLKKK